MKYKACRSYTFWNIALQQSIIDCQFDLDPKVCRCIPFFVLYLCNMMYQLCRCKKFWVFALQLSVAELISMTLTFRLQIYSFPCPSSLYEVWHFYVENFLSYPVPTKCRGTDELIDKVITIGLPNLQWGSSNNKIWHLNGQYLYYAYTPGF